MEHAARHVRVGQVRERNPDVAADGKLVAASHDADHCEALTVELDCPAENVPVGRETSPPERVPEYCYSGLSGLVLFGQKISAERRADAEQRKKVLRRERALQLFGLAAAREHE